MIPTQSIRKYAIVLVVLALVAGLGTRHFQGDAIGRVEKLVRNDSKVIELVGKVEEVAVKDVEFVKEKGPWQRVFVIDIHGTKAWARAEVSLIGEEGAEQLIVARISRTR